MAYRPVTFFIPGVDGFFRGIRGGIWREIRDTGRYGEMRGDARRYGEIQSDIGEIHQDTAKKPSALGLRMGEEEERHENGKCKASTELGLGCRGFVEF